MTVGHAKRVTRNARQSSDVADLLIYGFVHFAHQLFRRDDPGRHAHVFPVGRGQFPNRVGDFVQAIGDRHVDSYSYSFSSSCSCSNSDFGESETARRANADFKLDWRIEGGITLQMSATA